MMAKFPIQPELRLAQSRYQSPLQSSQFYALHWLLGANSYMIILKQNYAVKQPNLSTNFCTDAKRAVEVARLAIVAAL